MIFQTGGLPLKLLTIQDIKPLVIPCRQRWKNKLQQKHQRRATVTKADGEKQAAILEADGRFRSFTS